MQMGKDHHLATAALSDLAVTLHHQPRQQKNDPFSGIVQPFL